MHDNAALGVGRVLLVVEWTCLLDGNYGCLRVPPSYPEH